MKPFTTLVFEHIGQASMCWTERPRGIFESDTAKGLADEIVARYDALEAELAKVTAERDKLSEKLSRTIIQDVIDIAEKLRKERDDLRTELAEALKPTNYIHKDLLKKRTLERDDLKRQLAASVPRSRYDACNKDWADAEAKLAVVQKSAAERIEELERQLAVLETKWVDESSRGLSLDAEVHETHEKLQTAISALMSIKVQGTGTGGAAEFTLAKARQIAREALHAIRSQATDADKAKEPKGAE